MIANYLRCVNTIVQLPDNRILLYKGNDDAQWGVTIERYITLAESPLGCVNDILWNFFGINPFNYSDNFVEIKRYPPAKSLLSRNIVVYIMKLKASIMFQAKSTDKFRSVKWLDLLREVTDNSIYISCNSIPEHTSNSIEVLKELHIKGVF